MPLPPLHTLPAWQAARLLARREISALALAEACLERTAAREPQLQAFAWHDPEAVRQQARALDAGAVRGPLHGLPLGVKDLFDTADAPTAYGSPVYAGHRPASDAAAVTLCREAGALLAGKTVSTEFAYFTPGPTRNPAALDLGAEHTPGGSSSGSAAGVADALLPLALGTQTAGSVIRPAAFCGIVGYKPSIGRVPRAGIKSLSDALDTVGAFGRCLRDVALLGGVLTGDPRLRGLVDTAGDGAWPAPRIAWCPTPHFDQADADTRAAWALAEQGLASRAASWAEPPWPAALPDLAALQLALMSHEMARALRLERLLHGERLSARLRALLDDGWAIDGARHAALLAQRQQARQAALALFDHAGGADVLLAPSTIGCAPAGIAATGDPLFCRGWTLLGWPCVHLPFARGASGLPVGLQLVAREGDDHRLLAAAAWCLQRLAPDRV
jgi:Asp-tRNA(Asn)/Glu-tRNA(Gln) amidotransferase A subunit family amidase